MKNEFGTLKVKCLKGSLEFKRLTDEEIGRRLGNYFKTHRFLRRTDFQSLCGMVRSTVMRHLCRLRSEGKLENVGGLMQPIYVPGKGGITGNNEAVQ